MTVAFTQDEVVAVADWLKDQAMRDDLDTDLREGLDNAREVIRAMVLDLTTCRKGLADIRGFNKTVQRWVDGLLGDES